LDNAECFLENASPNEIVVGMRRDGLKENALPSQSTDSPLKIAVNHTNKSLEFGSAIF
jgi:hypothetical protein